MAIQIRPTRALTLVALLALVGLAIGSPALARERAPEPPKSKPQAATGEIDLRPRFVVGKVHKFDMELSDKEVPKPLPPGSPKPKAKPGQDPKAAVFSQKVGISLKVDAVDAEGNATLSLTLDSFKMSGDGPAGKIEFDSTKPADAQDPMDALFRSITTTTMKVSVDRNGEVKAITPDAAAGGGAASLISGNVTGGDFMKTLVGPIFSPRPGRTSARVGETWTEESQMKASAGDWTLVTTKTLRSHSGGRATIDIKGHVKIEPGSLGGGGTGANPKSETIQQGQAVWNTELGMVDSLNTKMLSEVGLLGGLGDLGKLGDLTGGLGGVDSEEGAQSAPSRHETTINVKRRH